MKKKILPFALILLAFFAFPKKCDASLLVIDKDGEVVWNILSFEGDSSLDIPRHSYIEVKNTLDSEAQDDSSVSLVRDNEKLSLMVLSGKETRELDVSGMQGDLVEIEERGETQKLSIGLSGDKFSLQQKDITALTAYPISVDSKSAEISLKTPSGERFLSILPAQAVDTLLRSKVLTKVDNNKVEIVEESRELQYSIEGEKEINLADVVKYAVPVKSRVSASTGEMLSVDAPIWYKMIAFLVS